MGEKIERAVAECELYRSELLRAALRHYIETNPKGYSAFESAQRSSSRPTTERPTNGSPENSNAEDQSSIYDPASDDWW